MARLNSHALKLTGEHNGGSALGYQGLPAPLAIPATATPDSGEIVFYASPALT
jgi:hypothetical protein